MRKKISTTIYVTPEQSDKLKVLHERTKVPVAVYIREGIDLVLKHYAHLLPGQLALVDSTLDVNASAKAKARAERSAPSSDDDDERDPRRAERGSDRDLGGAEKAAKSR